MKIVETYGVIPMLVLVIVRQQFHGKALTRIEKRQEKLDARQYKIELATVPTPAQNVIKAMKAQ
jgi:hypothetical protein